MANIEEAMDTSEKEPEITRIYCQRKIGVITSIIKDKYIIDNT